MDGRESRTIALLACLALDHVDREAEGSAADGAVISSKTIMFASTTWTDLLLQRRSLQVPSRNRGATWGKDSAAKNGPRMGGHTVRGILGDTMRVPVSGPCLPADFWHRNPWVFARSDHGPNEGSNPQPMTTRQKRICL